MKRRTRSGPRPAPPRQLLLPAIERSRRLERRFKVAIVTVTVLGLAGVAAGSTSGRYAVTWLANRAKWAAQGIIGLPPSRSDVEAEWRLKRQRGIEQTGKTYRDFFEKEASPAWRRILTAAGMAPDDALLRWANYDWTVVLSSKVFEADDTGRAYRMRPNLRAFWSRNHAFPHGLSSFFFLPDIPEVRSALVDAREGVMPESFQTTNSWGCRGPEPNTNAPVRGLIVGDSFMQGLFVPDDQTPPECLAQRLVEAWGVPVSILNTGHIGYSPEQYYHTLVEYYERFRPSFVVVSVCPNDFGTAASVMLGDGDWAEGKYWLNLIEQFCRTRGAPYFLVPVPFENQLMGRRNEGNYPGRVSNLADSGGLFYIDVFNDFTDENIRLLRDASRKGRRPATSPLFNGHLDDGHFSPLGCALWGRVVARRIALVLDPQSLAARASVAAPGMGGRP